MVLFVLHKLIQTRIHHHPIELDVWCLVGPIVYLHNSCVRTAKALARLSKCTGLFEPSLVGHVISTIISWAGSFYSISGPSHSRQVPLLHNIVLIYAMKEKDWWPWLNKSIEWSCFLFIFKSLVLRLDRSESNVYFQFYTRQRFYTCMFRFEKHVYIVHALFCCCSLFQKSVSMGLKAGLCFLFLTIRYFHILKKKIHQYLSAIP